jgi:membrane-bound lytic murein transglycosylase D
MRYRILLNICLVVGMASMLAACPASDTAELTHSKTAPEIEGQLSQYLPHPRSSNLWQDLAGNFQLKQNLEQPAVQKQIHFLQHRQDYINELTHNAKPYIYYVYTQTQKNNMPAEMALIPMVESDYEPFGVSRTGATGLWQMMPGTASWLGIKINWWYDGRRNVVSSTNAALKHLRYLHSEFGSWLLAMAAYDAGDGAIRSAIRYNKRHHRPTDFWSLPLPKETKRYIPKLLALAAVIKGAEHYGIHLKPLENRPYFTAVKMQGQIDLSHVAKLATTDSNTVRHLNPAFRRWATAPAGDYWLLLPVDKARIFQTNLTQSEKKRVTWAYHQVQSGDTLSDLADHYHTTITILQQINHIKGPFIHTGQKLLIPRSKHIQLGRIKKAGKRIAEDKIPGPKRIAHTVKTKETLSTIAQRYRVKAGQIRYWNHLAYHDKLQANQQLIIWKKKTIHPTGYHHYTIKSGDNLSQIGHRYHVSAPAIMAANGLSTMLLHIGQTLRIPYPTIHDQHYPGKHQTLTHTIRPGQSLSEIAHYYHVTSRDIIHWNHLEHQKYIHVGEKLKIYST